MGEVDGAGAKAKEQHEDVTMSDENRFWKELKEVRQTTRDLIDSVMMDVWPRNGAVIDFGIDSQEHYEALYYPIREHQIMPKELDEALGHGEKLTALIKAASAHSHKDVQFSTSWDGITSACKMLT
jgi:hypothetical protein